MVEIMFETAKAGKVAASIEAKEKGVSGFVAVDRLDTKKILESHISDITRGFGEEQSDLQIAYVSKLNFSRFSSHSASGYKSEESEEDMYEVQTKRLYQIAESFIENVKELEV